MVPSMPRRMPPPPSSQVAAGSVAYTGDLKHAGELGMEQGSM